MKKTILIAVFFFLFTPVLYAQEVDDYKNYPEYVDFGSFDRFQGAEDNVEVFLKGALLDFVATAAEFEDPDLASLLQNLKLIKVNAFSVDDAGNKEARNIIKSISQKIDRKKWELMVRSKEPGEYVEIYAHFGKKTTMTGLVVMTVQENEKAVFVNIVGDIDPTKLGKLNDKYLNIPQLKSLALEAKPHK